MDDHRTWARQTHQGSRVPQAWVELLASRHRLVGAMDQHLRAAHDLTINDYEVLLRLSWAEDGRMSRGDLADSVHLTYGGITRLLAGLEQAGLVESHRSSTDRRVTYAALTRRGQERFAAAAATHLADLRTLFTRHFTHAELRTLAELLGRLGDSTP